MNWYLINQVIIVKKKQDILLTTQRLNLINQKLLRLKKNVLKDEKKKSTSYSYNGSLLHYVHKFFLKNKTDFLSNLIKEDRELYKKRVRVINSFKPYKYVGKSLFEKRFFIFLIRILKDEKPSRLFFIIKNHSFIENSFLISLVKKFFFSLLNLKKNNNENL